MTTQRVAAFAMAFGAAVALGVSGCTRVVSTTGEPVKPQVSLSVDPAAVLLDAGDIDTAMGTSASKVVGEGSAPDDLIDASPPQCHGVVYIAGVIEYGSTGFTAMRWRGVGSPDSNVVQMVAQLPSAAAADRFLADQSKAWEACNGRVVVSTDKQSQRVRSTDRVTSVKTQPHSVIASFDGDPGTPCHHGQHALHVVSNYIIDVSTCGGTASDPAAAIASTLAERILNGG